MDTDDNGESLMDPDEYNCRVERVLKRMREQQRYRWCCGHDNCRYFFDGTSIECKAAATLHLRDTHGDVIPPDVVMGELPQAITGTITEPLPSTARHDELPLPGSLDEWFCIVGDCPTQIIGSPAYVARRAEEHMVEKHPGVVDRCTKPPAGWRCTRGRHADGPCAAVRVYPAKPRKKLPVFIYFAMGAGMLGFGGLGLHWHYSAREWVPLFVIGLVTCLAALLYAARARGNWTKDV